MLNGTRGRVEGSFLKSASPSAARPGQKTPAFAEGRANGFQEATPHPTARASRVGLILAPTLRFSIEGLPC